MIREAQIDRFAMAFKLSQQFCEDFATDRLEAINDYNENYARRYGEKPIELNEAEKSIVCDLPGTNLNDIFQALVFALDKDYSLQQPGKEIDISASKSFAA